MKYLLAILCFFPLQLFAASGDEVWTLQRCVNYALAHNISIQQDALNARLAALNLKQSQLSQLPNANLNTGYGISYGRSIDPTSNQFVSGSYQFTSVGGQADALIFGWFQKRNTIAKNKLNYLAAQADQEQLQNDVSLNVATGFLRALLAKEQIGVAQKQVALSEKQLQQTKQFAEAGSVPELNVAQMSAQLASDSSSLISALGDYQAAILDLKALLNLDFETPFTIQAPDLKLAELTEHDAYSGATVYSEALQHFAGLKSAQLKLSSAQKGAKAAKGNLLPNLTANIQVGTNYSTTYKDYGAPVQNGSQTIGYVDLGIGKYPINTPSYTVPVLGTTPFLDQYSNNLRHTYSLNLNIPLFNGWGARSALHQAQVQVAAQQLAQYNTELKLKQDVYKAVNDAKSSSEKYKAAIRAQNAAHIAYDFAEKRYNLGLTNTVEYLSTQNNQFKADAAAVSAKYDLIFRLKVIEYYLGHSLKL